MISINNIPGCKFAENINSFFISDNVGFKANLNI